MCGRPRGLTEPSPKLLGSIVELLKLPLDGFVDCIEEGCLFGLSVGSCIGPTISMGQELTVAEHFPAYISIGGVGRHPRKVSLIEPIGTRKQHPHDSGQGATGTARDFGTSINCVNTRPAI